MAPSAVERSTLVPHAILKNLKETAPSVLEDANTVSLTDTASLPELDASLLEVELTSFPRVVPDHSSAECKAQRVCTDHMVSAQWTAATGWAPPKLHRYGPLAIMPNSSCLHYATQCFEGMKLYRGNDGRLRLFRPVLNVNRFLLSSIRIALPGFNPAQILTLIEKLAAVDGPKWLPAGESERFLYIRPTMIANDPALGIRKPSEALFYVFLSIFPRLDSGNFGKGLKILASREDMVRAWPGGFGFAKVGANYGPTLNGQSEARARGFDQVLWLFGPEGYVTEAGAANFFVVWKSTETGKAQLVTAPLTDGLILDGVTRRSILDLAKERLGSELEVVEQRLTIGDIMKADEEGRLLEAFVSGTAYFIVGVEEITHDDHTVHMPVGDANCGTYARMMKTWLNDIMWGNVQHSWGHVIEE